LAGGGRGCPFLVLEGGLYYYEWLIVLVDYIIIIIIFWFIWHGLIDYNSLLLDGFWMIFGLFLIVINCF